MCAMETYPAADFLTTPLLKAQHDYILQHIPVETITRCAVAFLCPKSTFQPKHRGFVGDAEYCLTLTSYSARCEALYGAARGGNFELVNRVLASCTYVLLISEGSDDSTLRPLVDPLWALYGYARARYVEAFQHLWMTLKLQLQFRRKGGNKFSGYEYARIFFEAGRGGDENILTTLFDCATLWLPGRVLLKFKENALCGALRAGNLLLVKSLYRKITDQFCTSLFSTFTLRTQFESRIRFATKCSNPDIHNWIQEQLPTLKRLKVTFDLEPIYSHQYLFAIAAAKRGDKKLFERYIIQLFDTLKQLRSSILVPLEDPMAPICFFGNLDYIRSFVIDALSHLTDIHYKRFVSHSNVWIPKTSLHTDWWMRLYASDPCRRCILQTKNALALWQHFWTHARLQDRAALLNHLGQYGSSDAILFFSKQALHYTENMQRLDPNACHSDSVVACFLECGRDGGKDDGPKMLQQAICFDWNWILDAYFRNGWFQASPTIVQHAMELAISYQKWSLREHLSQFHRYYENTFSPLSVSSLHPIIDQNNQSGDLVLYMFRNDNPFCLDKLVVQDLLDNMCDFHQRSKKIPKAVFIQIIRCLMSCDFETCDGFFAQCNKTTANSQSLKGLGDNTPHLTSIEHNNIVCNHCSSVHRTIHKKMLRNFVRASSSSPQTQKTKR